jgi:hypothetical protein
MVQLTARIEVEVEPRDPLRHQRNIIPSVRQLTPVERNFTPSTQLFLADLWI